jgi:hypothetical protein
MDKKNSVAKKSENFFKRSVVGMLLINNNEVRFILKVLRNGIILSGLYFFSIWASTQQLDFLMHIKPILIFLGTYFLTECGKRYKVDIKNPQMKNKIDTIIF